MDVTNHDTYCVGGGGRNLKGCLNTILREKNAHKKDAGSGKFMVLRNEKLCDLYGSSGDIWIGYDVMNTQLG